MIFVLRIIRILCVMVSSVSVAVLVGVGSVFFEVPIISVRTWLRDQLELYLYLWGVLWVCVVIICNWIYALTEQKLQDTGQFYQKIIAIVWVLCFLVGYTWSTGSAIFLSLGRENMLASHTTVYSIPLWLVIINTASYNALYWQLNHMLNIRKSIAYRLSVRTQTDTCVEQPFDVWMGLAMFIASVLLPLGMMWIVQYGYIANTGMNVIYVLIIALSTMIGMGIWGFVRGLHSISAMMWMGMHGVIFAITLLLFVPQLPNIAHCVEQRTLSVDNQASLSFCVTLSHYWFDKWLSTIFAFIAIFGAALLASYSVDIKKLGWQSHELQYQNLAFIFTISAILILIESVMLIGIPLMMDILAIHSVQ